MKSFAAALTSTLLLVMPEGLSANLFRGGDDGYNLKGTRIIGGSKAEEDRHDYAVSMQDGGGHFCGGSMIGPRTVITAAHCLGGDMMIVVGSDDVDEGEKIKVAKQVRHPSYKSDTDEYDIGILFLEEATSLDISFVQLNNDSSYPSPGTTCHTLGWGDTDAGEAQKLSERLLITDVEAISNQQCADLERGGESYEEFGYDITDDMLCTYTSGQDACQGDSGGPLIVRNGSAKTDRLVGIVSWGVGCAYLPGVFARISSGYDWIQKTVCEDEVDLSDGDAGTLCGVPTEPPTTAYPTRAPTNKPTSQPTYSPTKNPTRSPTKKPTMNPTTSPTASPSSSPTEEPTLGPTASPTTTPSASPTISSQPTASPSVSPTVSSQPTSTPSASPTISSEPTTSPSGSPTTSTNPTVSSAPSIQPSSTPSSQPSASSNPTISSQPTVSSKPTPAPATVFAGNLGDSSALLNPDVSTLVEERGGVVEGEEDKDNASGRISHSFAIGALILSIISTWMVL